MHHFQEKNGELYCEDVPVRRVANQVGTPFYLYSHATLTRHMQVFDEAFSAIDHLVCYSVKANGNLAIIRLFANLGSGFDIVSGGELHRVLQAGGDASRVVFSGVGKSVKEIDEALAAGILCFNVESREELDRFCEAMIVYYRQVVAVLKQAKEDGAGEPLIVVPGKEN